MYFYCLFSSIFYFIDFHSDLNYFLSSAYFGMRLLEALKESKYILPLGRRWIIWAQKADCGTPSSRWPLEILASWFLCPCIVLSHSHCIKIVLCEPQNVAEVMVFHFKARLWKTLWLLPHSFPFFTLFGENQLPCGKGTYQCRNSPCGEELRPLANSQQKTEASYQ